MSSTQSDNGAPQNDGVPKSAKTSGLWNRFLDALTDLPHPKSDDQTVIGKQIGVGQTMVSSIKTGDKNPGMDTAIAMAGYADMCVEYLLTGKGPKRPWGGVDADFQRLVQFWESLDDTGRGELLKRADELFRLQGQARRPSNPLPGEPPHRPTRKAPH